MSDKLLVVIPEVIPSTEIILRTLYSIYPRDKIKIVTQNNIKLKECFSGEYRLLLIRLCAPHLRPFLHLLKKNKINYLYYLDDNFWEIKSDTPLGTAFQNETVKKVLTGFVKYAFHVIAGSPNLRDYIKQFTNSVSCINAAFDFSIFNNITKEHKTDLIKILYSGSLYREHDFECVIPALKKVANDYPNSIRIYFNGFAPKDLKDFKNTIIEKNFYPYDIYLQKQYKTNFDIGIAPLADTLSNRAKSNLKFREYGACHIAGIYTNIPPYSDCITHNETGLLISHNEEEWYNAIRYLIENKRARNRMAKKAYQEVKKNYTHSAIACDWSVVLSFLPTNKKINISSAIYIKFLTSKLLRIKYNLIRTRDYLRYFGLVNTIKKIIQKTNLIKFSG